MSEPSAIGRQLKRLRTERGLSQAELAEHADVSPDLVAKLEQGSRQTARLTSLAKLANGLDVDIAELLGQRPRMDRGADTGSLLAVRNVLLSPSLLPGIDPADDGGEPTPIGDLHRAVETGWEHYWSGRFGRLAGMLPSLIGEARITAPVAGPPAAGALAQAYDLAACLMIHVGKYDQAAIGSERAMQAAVQGNDELQWAALQCTYSWVLLRQGRFGEAERHAAQVAERIEPSLTRAPAERLTVWGGLVLNALAAAAADRREPEVAEYISLAQAGAARLGADRHDYWISFGPTQVAMQATHAHTLLGNPGKALQAANGVRRDQVFQVSYGRHLLDVAQAQLDARRYQEATTALQQAREVSAEWFRHQGLARSIVSDLVSQRRRLTPALRTLARAIELS